MKFITEWGNIAGIAGISLGVFLILFREVIRKNIFSKLTKKQSYVIIILFMLLVWSLSIFSIFQYNIYNSSSIQLTIIVHGAEGKQDIVLENTGRLIVDIGNERRTPMIGQDGVINFSEIQGKPSQEIGIALDAPGYELINKEEQYKLDGKSIYISVKRDSRIGMISGIVKNRNGSILLKDALIMIGTDTTILTDTSGRFKITLPEKMFVPNIDLPYLLTVKKEGYKMKPVRYKAKSGDIEIRLNAK